MSVSMSNRVMKSKQIKTRLIKKAKPINILLPTDQIDYKNIKTGLMPNFIHSLDASNIHILIKNILKYLPKQNINLYTIHDCFASVNDQMDIVETLVRKAFSALYFEKNYLAELDVCLVNQIKSYGIDIQTSDKGVRLAVFPRAGKTEILEIPSLPAFN